MLNEGFDWIMGGWSWFCRERNWGSWEMKMMIDEFEMLKGNMIVMD